MSFLGDSCLGCLFDAGCSAIGCGSLIVLLLIAGLTTGVIGAKRVHHQAANNQGPGFNIFYPP